MSTDNLQPIAPLTTTQLGIYIDSIRDTSQPLYHTPHLRRLPGVDDAKRLAEAFEKVVAAYPAMSARIITGDDGVPSWVDASASSPLQIETVEMTDEQLRAGADSLVTPFDLEGGVLAHVKIITTEKGVYLFTDFHHTLFDATSHKAMLRALDAAYRGEEIEKEGKNLFDLAADEAALLASPALEEARAAYTGLLEGADGTFDILSDVASTSRSAESYEETEVELDITAEAYREACRSLALPQSVPATAAMGAALQVFYRRDDVTFATIYHGRRDHRYDDTFGMMVKTLPVRIKATGNTTTRQLMADMASWLKIARDNDLYSFAEAAREFGVNSEFLFAYQGEFLSFPGINGAEPEEIAVDYLATGSKVTAELYNRGGRMKMKVQYRSDLFSKALIDALLSTYSTLLSQILTVDGATPLSQLSLLSPSAEAEVTAMSDGGPSLAAPGDTITKLLREASSRYPDNIAVVYRDRRLTYAELDRLSDNLAAYLTTECKVGPTSKVGVMIERSELMALLPIAVMKTGAAYMPLDPHFPEERLMFMIEDAGVELIIGDDGLAGEVLPSFKGRTVGATVVDTLPDAPADPATAPRSDSPMVVLYTSGSTGKPKGVTLTQGNIANYVAAYRDLTRMTSDDRTGAYAAFGFDAHMMDIYPTLASGATVHIFDSEMRLDLTAMHQYMDRERISVIFMTTQIIWQMVTLFEFPWMRVMCGGGEKLPPLGQLPFTFYNVYGPTECSVLTTAYKLIGVTDGKDIGRPLPGYQVRILDRYLRPVPRGVAGELVILGPGVGLGYLNREELTAEKFIGIDGLRAYRTGDHGRYMENGDIEFLGRIDGMVKLRGLRIELGEVEAVASGHPEVKTFVAAVKQVGGMENLAGYYVAAEGSGLEPEQLQDYMRESLTEFMVPEIMMRLDEMPLTPNGKVDRKRLPVPERSAVETVAPANDAEQRVYDLCVEVLGHDNFGVTTNLLSAGLTSLMAMRLVASIAKNTGTRVTAKAIMSSPTVRDIAPMLAEGVTAEAAAPHHDTKKRRYYPLTENQRGVFIDWEMNRGALQYNIPQAFGFAPGTDARRLRDAVEAVVKAHPGLMTGIVLRQGDVMQERRDIMPEITVTRLEKAPDAEFFQQRIHPFDLLSDILFRCEIFTYGDSVYMLLDTHHIIFDGVSAMVFMKELSRAYSGLSPEGEELSALDNALREKDLLESDEYVKAGEWFDTLTADTESTSYPRSSRPDNDIAGGMGRIRLTVPSGEIREYCSRNAITPSNYLLSSMLQLLHRLTREETVQITTVNNGRNDVRLMGSTGMFVKTLPVVSRCSKPGTLTPAEFAAEIQRQFLTTQDYDFYPFTELVEKRGVRPEIMYVYEGGINLSGSGDGELQGEKIALRLDTAKVPLTVLVFEDRMGDFELVAEYDTSCYNRDDMTVLLKMMRSLSLSLPHAAKLTDGVMTDSDQQAQIESLCHGKRVEVPYRSMHGTMELRAQEHPDTKALVACDRTLTYRELDEECNRIANALMKRGVGHGDRIVILLPRKASLVTAIYGAMKTGSAYIPCDPDYPAERIRLITEDSGARFIITTADRCGLYDNAIDIEELLAETDTTRPDVDVNPEDVAYMIYTSGSTGRPKGVMIPQRAICNYLYGYYDMNYRDRPEIKVEMLLVTISFDASLNNLGVSLTCGHTLVLADEEECKDVVMLSRLMLDNAVDSLDITPSRLEAMLDLPEFREAVARCSHINIGGEGFQTTLIAKLFDTGFRGKAINEYGPTETTVGSNRAELTPYTPVIAGPPFYNDTQRIVDAWGGELPVGAVGELYISGLGLGLGYNNLPEKTAEAYVEYHGERAYRTGDLARRTAEGDMVILGRIDHQVKLRGLRIELGEIECVAMEYDGIGKVAANVCEVNNIQHLCLYYTATSPVDNDKLREHLASRLTEYMVPDAYMEIAEMPLTPNGKTNRKALPLPEIAPAAEYVEPVGELEKKIAEAFTSVLHNERTGANDDFFAIGGTSISAIKVVAALSLAGYTLTYKNVFAARTPRALARLIAGGDEAQSMMPVESAIAGGSAAQSEYAEILDRNTVDAFLTGHRQELGDVLLTGATGFMGIHMLHDLIVNHDCRITCLLRRKGELSAESRLRTLLFYYFDRAFEQEFAEGRIKVVEGDVITPVGETMAGLLNFDTVINCAANVKHFSAGNDIELVNVESVRNLIDLCLDKGARLVHVSTISIAGESVNGYPDPSLLLTERMLDFGQSLSNQYVHSKYEAERLIMAAVRDRGLSAKIMRVGNLSARGTDGEFQINFRSNAFMGKLKAYVTLGCAPYAVMDAPCEFSPIDEVCRAILLLATTPRDMVVFQPCNNHRLPLGDVLHILGDAGMEVKAVETEEFKDAQREAMTDPQKVNALQPLMAYESDKTSRTTFIRYDSGFTNQILYRLGFRWNYTSHDYVERFIKAIDALNFFAL